jgi:hypothetical protein
MSTYRYALHAMSLSTNSAYIALGALALLAIGFVVTIVRIRYRVGLRDIPGPFFASILPFDRVLSTYSGHQFQRHLDYHAQYGNLVRVGPNHVSLGNSDQISNVYSITSKFDKVSMVSTCISFVGTERSHRAISILSSTQSHRLDRYPRCFQSSTQWDTRI